MVQHAALVAVTLAAVLAIPARCEEGAAMVSDSAPVAPGIAGFHPVSDVTAHSMIDLDIQEIERSSSDWATAKSVYEGGKNSKKSDGSLRNLKAFSTSFVDSASKQAEPMAQLGHAFWGRYDFGDALVTAALDGKDDARFGNYATGSLASTADARKQVIKKGIKFSVVWLYALHEMESALAKYKAGNYDPASGAPHALDEVWAFYAGSLELGDASGYGPYIAAEKNGKKFGTHGYETGTPGRSRVTLELLYQLTAMQRYLQTPGNDQVLDSIAKCVRAQFKVPLIQGCLSYAHAASSEALTEREDLPKIKAEAWAYCAPILPSLHEADPSSALVVQDTVSISSDQRPDWDAVKKAFSTENVNKMGIMCEDIGYLGSNGYNADKFDDAPPLTDQERTNCQDDAALISANPSADSSKCAAVKMPRCASGMVCSSSVRLQSSRAWALAILGLAFLYLRPH